MLKKVFILLFIVSLAHFSFAQKNVVDDSMLWQPNGKVNKLKVLGDTLIIAGDFNTVGPNTPYASSFDANGDLDYSFPHTNGEVSKAIADDKNGFYITGEFSKIGNANRGGLAYVDSMGKISSFFEHKAINGRVYDMKLKDSLLYIAGEFTGTNEYTGGGAVVKTDTALIDFTFPKIEGSVYTSVADGDGGVYIGGLFTQVGEYERANIAHIDKYGRVTPWNPGTDGEVRAIAIDERHIYVGGFFSYAGCSKRLRLAVFEKNSNTPNTWDYSITLTGAPGIFALLVYGGKLYVGTGQGFGGINYTGYGVGKIYGIDRNNGSIAFTRKNISDVHVLEAGPGYVFAGGDIYTTGTFLYKVIRVDTNYGNDLTRILYPEIKGTVYALKYYKDILYIGGYHTNYTDIIAYNVKTGNRYSFNSQFDGVIYDFEIVDDSLLVASGVFKAIDNQNNIGAFNINTKNKIDWPYQTGKPVLTICKPTANTMFFGGDFYTINTGNEHNIAAINIYTSQQKQNWGFNLNEKVRAIQIVDSSVYIGGDFSRINFAQRIGLARLSTKDTALSSWYPAPNQYVHSLALKGDSLYIAGNFTKLGSSNISYLGLVNRNTGAVLPWNANLNGGPITDVLLHGSKLFICGGFSKVNGATRISLAALDANTASPLSFNVPTLTLGNALVNNISLWNNKLVCAGILSSYYDNPQKFIAIYDTASGAEVNTSINASFNINTTASTNNGKLFIGGLFRISGGVVRRNIAFINLTTGRPLPWHADIDEEVFDFDVADGKIYYTGFFQNVKGYSRKYIAATYLATDSLHPWNPVLDQYPSLIHIADGKAFVGGGMFTKINGVSRTYFAAIDTGTAQATAFQPFLGATSLGLMFSISSYKNNIYASGIFGATNKFPREFVAGFNISTGALDSFDAKIGSTSYYPRVSEVFTSGNTLYIGGDFSKSDTSIAKGFLRLNADSITIDHWSPNSNDIAIPMAQKDDDVYVGLGKSTLNNKCRCFISAIDTNTKQLSPWHPQIELTPASIDFWHNKVYMGGEFTTFNNAQRDYLTGATMEAIDIVLPEGNIFCRGAEMNIKLNTSGTFDSANKFVLLMSDSMGSFANPIYMDTITASIDSFIYNLPLTFPPNSNYRLKVFSTAPALTNREEVNIIVIPDPKTEFIVDSLYKCAYKNFEFTNTSTPEGSVTWKFGDGNTGNKQIQQYAYPADGAYDVWMVFKPIGVGCPTDSATKTIEVLPTPKPSFIVNDSIQCLSNNLFVFTNTSTVSKGNMTYMWVLTDTNTSTDSNTFITYADTGSYTINLIATSDSGCIDSVKKNVVVFNTLHSSFTVNNPSQCLQDNNFIFTNTSTPLVNYSILWKLGENDTDSMPIVQKTFNTDSVYKIELFISLDSGCFDSSSLFVSVNPHPASNFIVDSNYKCANDTFYFTNTSIIKTGTISNYYWEFGNKQSNDTSQNTYIVFDSVGSFKTSLIARSDSGCYDTSFVHVSTNPLPITKFNVNDTVQCFKTQLFLFTDSSSTGLNDSIVLYNWGFGDSTFDNTKNPSHQYNNVGYYFVTLKTTNTFGCSNTAKKTSIVVPEPHIDTIMGPTSVYSTDTSLYIINKDTFNTYYWSVDFGTLLQDSSKGYATIIWDSVATQTNATIQIIPVNIAGCIGDTAYLTVFIDTLFSTSIYSLKGNQISIYPNPTSKTLHILFANSNTINGGEIEIFDAVGKRVYKDVMLNEKEIDVSGFNPGIYTITILTQQGVVSSKFIVIKE
jgi:PKD repeat protein